MKGTTAIATALRGLAKRLVGRSCHDNQVVTAALDPTGDTIVYVRLEAGADEAAIGAEVAALAAWAGRQGLRPRLAVAGRGVSGSGRFHERPDLLAMEEVVGEGWSRFVVCREPTCISNDLGGVVQFALWLETSGVKLLTEATEAVDPWRLLLDDEHARRLSEAIAELAAFLGQVPATVAGSVATWCLDAAGDGILFVRSADAASSLVPQAKCLLEAAAASGRRPRLLVAAPGVGGSSPLELRPDLATVAAGVEEGWCRFVACVEADRVARRVLVVEQFLDLLQTAGVELAVVRGGRLVTGEPLARLTVAVAAAADDRSRQRPVPSRRSP